MIAKKRRTRYTIVTRHPDSLTETITTRILAFTAQEAIDYALSSVSAWGHDGRTVVAVSASVVRS